MRHGCRQPRRTHQRSSGLPMRSRSIHSWHLLWPVLLTVGSLASGAEPRLPPPAMRHIDFVKDVRPVLAASCYSCHGDKKHKGDLRLDRKASALRGQIIVPGKSADSPLIQRVAGLDPDAKMPPKGPGL